MSCNFYKEKKHKSTGFTLLEILIALFIFTIVSLIMTKALHTVFTSQSATEQRATRLAKLQIALFLISQDMEQIIQRPFSNAAGITEGFIGTPHAVTFVHSGWVNPFARTRRPTLQRTSYELANNNLLRTSWPELDTTTLTKPGKRTLLDSVTELQFAYLDEKGQFQSSWPASGQNTTSLPHAIRISLTLKKWGTLSQLYIIPGPPIEKHQ